MGSFSSRSRVGSVGSGIGVRERVGEEEREDEDWEDGGFSWVVSGLKLGRPNVLAFPKLVLLAPLVREAVFCFDFCARALWSRPMLGFDFAVVDFFTLEVGLAFEVVDGRGGRKGFGGMILVRALLLSLLSLCLTL